MHSKYIILWACNTLNTNSHHWPFIEQARKAGAKLVVIDPVQTHTARLADWHIPIRPGTDAALALAMMHIIIKESLIGRRVPALPMHCWPGFARVFRVSWAIAIGLPSTPPRSAGALWSASRGKNLSQSPTCCRDGRMTMDAEVPIHGPSVLNQARA